MFYHACTMLNMLLASILLSHCGATHLNWPISPHCGATRLNWPINPCSYHTVGLLVSIGQSAPAPITLWGYSSQSALLLSHCGATVSIGQSALLLSHCGATRLNWPISPCSYHTVGLLVSIGQSAPAPITLWGYSAQLANQPLLLSHCGATRLKRFYSLQLQRH